MTIYARWDFGDFIPEPDHYFAAYDALNNWLVPPEPRPFISLCKVPRVPQAPLKTSYSEPKIKLHPLDFTRKLCPISNVSVPGAVERLGVCA
jgi:hypothetical protein